MRGSRLTEREIALALCQEEHGGGSGHWQTFCEYKQNQHHASASWKPPGTV
jgi:hypothetical protein